jgi:hypothetical protein
MNTLDGTCKVTMKNQDLISEDVEYHLKERILREPVLNSKAGKQWYGHIILKDNKAFLANNQGGSILLHLSSGPLEVVVVRWTVDSPFTGRYEVEAYRGHE